MLRHLQLFLVRDFYEYNSIPYQRYTSYALHNLADFAKVPSVRVAAQSVLDYLTAKFAVGSNDLRRLPPFRRRAESQNVNPFAFFGPAVDATAARLVYLAELYGRVDDASEPRESPDDKRRLRFGHAHIALTESLLLASLTSYSSPSAIRALLRRETPLTMFHVFNHKETQWDTGHFAFPNDGFEIAASHPEFLITAGGVIHDAGMNASALATLVAGLYYRENHAILPVTVAEGIIKDKLPGNYGAPRPTTLIPTLGGRTPGGLVAFEGATLGSLRFNTCVAPGFACGLNPRFPRNIIAAGQCRVTSVVGAIGNYWRSKGGPRGVLGCPLSGELPNPDGPSTYVVFQGGVVSAWPLVTPGFVLAAWVTYDPAYHANDRIHLEWTDAPASFLFQVLGDKGGFYAPAQTQGDVPVGIPGNFLATSGRVELEPWNFVGRYDLKVSFCKLAPVTPNAPSWLDCDATKRPHVNVNYDPPPIGQPNSPPLACNSNLEEGVLFLDAHGQCDPRGGGFYLALVLRPCPPVGRCRELGRDYGLLEAASPGAFRDFDDFQRSYRNRNGVRTYAFDVVNEHQMEDGTIYQFVFQPERQNQWAIRNSSNASLAALAAADMDTWPRVKGEFITNDGQGHITIGVPGSEIRIDVSNPGNPQRRE